MYTHYQRGYVAADAAIARVTGRYPATRMVIQGRGPTLGWMKGVHDALWKLGSERRPIKAT